MRRAVPGGPAASLGPAAAPAAAATAATAATAAVSAAVAAVPPESEEMPEDDHRRHFRCVLDLRALCLQEPSRGRAVLR